MRHGVLAMVLLAASAGIAQPQSLLSGNVLTLDSTYIVAAHITLHDSAGKLKAEALTDSAGGFRFRVANMTRPVTLYISIIRIGYVSIELVPVSLGRREDVTVRVHMSPHAVELAPVTVVARQRTRSAALDDYYDKLDDIKRGIGHALERNVMEQHAGSQLVSALQRVPGVQYGNVSLRGGINLAVPRMRGGCIPLTFLDRVPIAADELAVIDPANLEGVLVYVGGLEVPVDFSQLSAGVPCGLILAYTARPSPRRSTISLRNTALGVVAVAAIVLISR
ncbi:MAG: TonB-dependent receptor plug domain-containing protein [Gemmatimonadota bacterium]